jgi:tetratricopeptide (TPR) repeat protein
MAEQLRKEASVLLDQGKISNAIDRLKEAIAANSKCDECWLDLENALRRLHEGKVPLDARDAMIKVYPLSAFPHLFKAVALFKDDQFSQADGEFAKAMNLEPRSPYVYGFMLQIHTLTGEYEKALGEHKTYTALGGATIFEPVARQYGFLLLALDRQFTGKNLPATDWKMPEDFDAIATLSEAGMPFLLWLLNNVEDQKIVLGEKGATGPSKKYIYEGSKDSPLEYAPGLYIWDATVLVTPQDGILLLNGSKLKYVSVVKGVKKARFGAVKNWRFEFEEESPTR